MEEVIKIFEQIKNTSSTNDKKAIIKAHKDNELFKKCLVFLLDNNITTGISDKKWDKYSYDDVFDCGASIDDFCRVLDYVKKHNSGKKEDIIACKNFSVSWTDEQKEFLKQIITKKYRLGCDKKVVNSVIPKLIPTWDIQQAYPLSEKNRPKDGDIFFLSQKLNGNNASFYHHQLISRQGKPFKGLEHIINDLQRLPRIDDYFINGELIRKNNDNLSDNDNFQLGTGIINSDDSDKSCIKFVIYEIIPVEEFENGESQLTYKQRRHTILNPFSTAISRLNTDNIEVLPIIYEGTDQSVIEKLLQDAVDKGWEGLMLNKDTKWKNKRNNGILKVKAFKNADILCTGVVEGEGKYQETLGLIKCDYKGNELGVGSGFTDEQRNYYWNHPDEIVDHIVQIKYKEETKNKNGGISVQFPIFQCVRENGKEVSYNG